MRWGQLPAASLAALVLALAPIGALAQQGGDSLPPASSPSGAGLGDRAIPGLGPEGLGALPPADPDAMIVDGEDPASAFEWLDRQTRGATQGATARPRLPQGTAGSGNLPLNTPEQAARQGQDSDAGSADRGGAAGPRELGLSPADPGALPLTRGTGRITDYDPGRPDLPGDEPPVAQGIDTPDITTRPIGAAAPGAVGLLTPAVTGLPAGLWQGSHASDLARAIDGIQVQDTPALQALLSTLMLLEAAPPVDDPDGTRLLAARLERLRDMGAVAPALSLADLAQPDDDPALFSQWFDLALLMGEEDRLCRRIDATPALAPSEAARVFCLARAPDWFTASLIFQAGAALDSFTPAQEHLLQRFLDDTLDDGALRLPAPARVTPLLFRLSEAIGEPLPTAALPRAFAVSDLRGVSGWKAELEAAERLARAGAIAPNQLLGIYTKGRPAASGGIWDRVAALQAFDSAISARTPDRDAVLASLPAAWAAMEAAQLELPFAQLYGAALAEYADAPGAAGQLAFTATLLGPDAAERAAALTPRDPRERFLKGLALGRPDAALARDGAMRMVARGFDPATRPPDRLLAPLQDGRLGEAILGAIRLWSVTASGDMKDGAATLATFRSLGLEDTARAAALELLLLERRG